MSSKFSKERTAVITTKLREVLELMQDECERVLLHEQTMDLTKAEVIRYRDVPKPMSTRRNILLAILKCSNIIEDNIKRMNMIATSKNRKKVAERQAELESFETASES